MEAITEAAFERLVAEALDELPQELGSLLDNVVILVEDENPDEPLLGLYEGVPQTERDGYGAMELPDRITLYRLSLCESVEDLDALRAEVQVTLVHEVAHHFGIDDDRLVELGWD